jgi:hypothetical protein
MKMLARAVATWGTLLVLAAAIHLGIGSVPQALAGTVDLTIVPLHLHARAEGVRMVDLELKVRGTSLVEGVLELESVSIYRSQDLVLPPGAFTLRALLPGSFSPDGGADAVSAALHGRDGKVIPLGFQTISGNQTSGRACTIAVCAPPTFNEELRSALWQALLPKHLPEEQGESVAVAPAFLLPEDLPANPLAFCAFDVVLLIETDVALLGEKQTRALQHWVQGGGSLCVTTRADFAPATLDALDTLFGLSKPRTAAATSISAHDDDAETITLSAAGCGRVVLIGNAAGISTLASPERFAAIAYLWNLERRTPNRQGAPGKKSSGPRPPVWAFSGQRANVTKAEAEVLRLLLADLRVAPFALVACVLVVFVLSVGPLDYYLLRRWRRRPWRWLFFPAVSVACTLFLIWLPGHYFSKSDQRRSVIVNDIGPQGKVLRQSRLQMEFSGDDTVRTMALQNVLCTPLHEPPAAPVYTGLFPSQFTFSFAIRKWDPQLLRLTSLTPEVDRSGIDWDELGRRLKESRDVLPLLREHDVIAAYVADKDRLRPIIPGPLMALATLLSGWELPRRGEFIARTAPHGGKSLTDLLFDEPRDPSRLSLTTVQKSGRDYVMSRHVWER